MPELPEVQTVVDDLNRAAVVGATITRARVFWTPSVAEPASGEFCRRLAGQTVAAIRRRAKFIVLDLSGQCHLLIHLRMSGRLNLVSTAAARAKHEHVCLGFDDRRELRLHDARKFARCYLVNDANTILGSLGPEPLARSFSARRLHTRLNARRRMLKPLLLDQAFIAGLGNIYVDEALWYARLHPCRQAGTLSRTEAQTLLRAIRKVLRRGLDNLGTTLGSGRANFYSVGHRQGRNQDQLQAFRRTGCPCPRCRTTIKRIVVGQRSTHICPRCQNR
jgi:formamidopyrimidine-DNA glycosylase